MENKKRTIYQFLSCIILLFIAYVPTIKWMVDRWFEAESYYGHGFLIPIVSAYVIWQRREILKNIEISGEGSGLFIVIMAVFIHALCALLKVYFISGFTFVFAIFGLILFFFGKKMAKNLIFPVFFLLAMIPLPLVLISNLTVRLKLFAAQCATVILNKIGFPSIRDGSIIRMPNSYIAVEAPCSGLRSLIALLTLGILFAYAMKTSLKKKTILIISSVPIAIAANVVRIIMLASINDLYGENVSMGFFHEFSGFFVFGFAFAGLLVVGKILEPRKENSE